MSICRRDKFLSILMLLCCPYLVAQTTWKVKTPIPTFSAPVVDNANVLSQGEESKLNSLLDKLYKEHSIQVAILSISELQGDEIEEYSLSVAETWKLGKADTDQGLLLVFSLKDRKIRIEVGQGLEGSITDAFSNQIIQNIIVPGFRQNNYGGTLLLATSNLIHKILPDYNTQVDERISSGKLGAPKSRSKFYLFLGLALLIFIFGGPSGARRSRAGALGGFYAGGRSSGSFGGFSGGGGGGFSGGGSSGGW